MIFCLIAAEISFYFLKMNTGTPGIPGTLYRFCTTTGCSLYILQNTLLLLYRRTSIRCAFLIGRFSLFPIPAGFSGIALILHRQTGVDDM